MTRILVVDDDAAVRSVVTEALLEDGYQVDTACNGR
jgi:CheY-like chemotaxis protein